MYSRFTTFRARVSVSSYPSTPARIALRIASRSLHEFEGRECPGLLPCHSDCIFMLPISVVEGMTVAHTRAMKPITP